MLMTSCSSQTTWIWQKWHGLFLTLERIKASTYVCASCVLAKTLHSLIFFIIPYIKRTTFYICGYILQMASYVWLWGDSLCRTLTLDMCQSVSSDHVLWWQKESEHWHLVGLWEIWLCTVFFFFCWANVGTTSGHHFACRKIWLFMYVIYFWLNLPEST